MDRWGKLGMYWWSESVRQCQKTMKVCGSVPPRIYGENMKRSKKKRKKVMRGK